MTEELHRGPPQPTPPVESGREAGSSPALPVSDELRRAVEDAQSVAAEPSSGLAPEPEPAVGGPDLGVPWPSIESATAGQRFEAETPPPVLPGAPVEVTTRPMGEWRIAVDPRSATTDDVAIHSGFSEGLALQELRAVPLGSAAPAAPAWRPWRRDRSALVPENTPEPAAAPALGEPLAPRAAPRQRLTGRERRWVRRRRRVVFEEVLAWVLVPVILIACYWLLKSILAGMGTTPTALFEGIKGAIQGLDRR